MNTKSFVLNILSTFFLCAFSMSIGISALYGQVDTTFYPPLDSIDPFPSYPRAILSPYKETGNVEVFATVEYSTHTRVYIRMSNVANTTYRMKVGTNDYPLSQVIDGKWEIDFNLPQNTSAKVVSKDVGQIDTDLIDFNTSHGVRDVFEASDELMTLLSNWAQDAPSTPLLTYILASNLHPVEKYDYIQHHFFKDEVLPNTFVNAFPTESDIEQRIVPRVPMGDPNTSLVPPPDKLPCICSFVVRVGHDIFPYNTYANGQIEPNYGHEMINQDNWEYWHDWSFEGLPRFYQQHSQGEGNEAVLEHTAGISYFKNEILYNCSNSPNSLPEGCDCEVPVNYDFKYVSELYAYADARRCFGCGNRDAETKVNDMVFAYFADDAENNEQLGSNAGTAWAIEKRDDPKIVKLILPVLSIAANLATIAGTKGLKLALSYTKLAVDMAKVVDILNDPSSKPKTKESNGFMEMKGSGQKNILPNVRSEFVVMSLTLHGFDNRRRFFTHNRVLSSGYLQTWIEGGPLEAPGENPNCCVPHITQYAQAAFTNRYTPQNMMDHMSNNYSLAMPKINNQIGHLTAAVPGCNVPVEGREKKSDVKAVWNQDVIFLEKTFTTPFDFGLYDMSGRCLYQGKQTENVVNLQNLNLSNGVFIFKAQSEEVNTTLRFTRI
jgi:hypothetical protein